MSAGNPFHSVFSASGGYRSASGGYWSASGGYWSASGVVLAAPLGFRR